MNSARDPHKKCSHQHKHNKRVAIQINIKWLNDNNDNNDSKLMRIMIVLFLSLLPNLDN